MFSFNFLTFSFYLLCVVFSTRVNGITTKSLPLVLDNSSDTSQFVQIRSAFNQPTRTFLVQHKSALSPVQQTHILDDVQKNQRVHYQPPRNNGDDRHKTLFANNAQAAAPLSQTVNTFGPVHPNSFEPSKFASFANLNSLSAPPLQTVVLSPQQTLPTSPSHVGDYFSPYRPSSANVFSHNSPEIFEFNPVTGSSQKVFYSSATVPTVPHQHADNFVTNNVEQNLHTSRYTTPTPHHSTFPKLETGTYNLNNHYQKYEGSTPASVKPYHNKDASSSIFAPLVEKPKSSSKNSSDKLIKEVYLKTNPEILIAKDRQKFFQQLLEDNNKNEDLESDDDQTAAQNDLGNIRSQFEKEILRQLKESVGSGPSGAADLALLGNSSGVSEFSLPNGQKVQISRDYNRLLEEADGTNKIKAIVVKQFPSSTTPKSNILDELTKGVVPPGAEFEVIKRNKDGGLEEIGKLPQNIPQKKVTFVILEEQPDGSVKVQGVRGSEKESLKESGEEVDTIIRKIKEGELKLPPSTRLSPKQSQKFTDNGVKKSNRGGSDQSDTKSKRKSGTATEIRPAKRKEQHTDQYFIPTPIVQAYTTPETTKSDTYPTIPEEDSPYQYFSSSPSTYYVDDKYTGNYVSSTPSFEDGPTILNQLASETWNYANQDTSNSIFAESSTPTAKFADNLGLFHLNNSGYIASLFSTLKTQPTFTFDTAGKSNIIEFPLLPTTLGSRILEQNDHNASGIPADHLDDGLAESGFGTIRVQEEKKDTLYKKRDRNITRKTNKKPIKEIRRDNDEEESNVEETKTEDFVTNNNHTLSDALKREGFYAMARFLRQSGLDSILNDTGPFTLFIPTDKAFRTLLIQLGGPDKAEEKFKENPRLLSGLLLHHVIPGAFRVNTLQDEMTGVSLAGTQLRINTYTTHDIEWNDITVVTVNGAKVLDEKDIVIPQGIAHAIDRVMFPLPVGNLLQSLQADRENRYSNFLKILEESELSYLLTGGKTFTLFAPLNRAFTHAEFTKILADPNESKSFVLRHIVPGALYSAGMKYYQVRDSMEDGQQMTLYKEAGKIKVNNAHVVTRNVPATNGVIHAIDAFL